MSNVLGISALKRAIEIAGSQTALAKLISTKNQTIKQQNISWWLNESMEVPAEMAPKIEKATGIAKEHLRPDIFQ